MNKHKGFTIVELLIVIVIIGILAAISIVAYNGVQEKARDSIVKSDLSGAMKALGMYVAEHGVPPNNSSALSSVGIQPTKDAYMNNRNNFYYCANRNTGAYAIGAVTKDDHVYLATSTDGVRRLSAFSLSSGTTCQATGLAGYPDSNAYAYQGYNYSDSGSTWSAWVK